MMMTMTAAVAVLLLEQTMEQMVTPIQRRRS